MALRLDGLSFTPQGMRVHLKRSKTDQEGKGRDSAIPYGRSEVTCPVRATRAWVDAVTAATSTAKAEERFAAPLLRSVNRHGGIGQAALSAETVGDIVKHLVDDIRLDETLYAGHSLRAGLATSAAMEGADDRSIMRQTGHKLREMVGRYIRVANFWKDNAASRASL